MKGPRQSSGSCFGVKSRSVPRVYVLPRTIRMPRQNPELIRTGPNSKAIRDPNLYKRSLNDPRRVLHSKDPGSSFCTIVQAIGTTRVGGNPDRSHTTLKHHSLHHWKNESPITSRHMDAKHHAYAGRERKRIRPKALLDQTFFNRQTEVKPRFPHCANPQRHVVFPRMT